MADARALSQPLSIESRPIVAAAIVAAALVIAEVALSWRYLTDDALIHVRYAELLLQAGFLTSDGVHPSFGVSSPAFVLLNALGYWLKPSPLVAKVLSVIGYGLVMAVMTLIALRARSRVLRLLYFSCLALGISPFAVRWLANGMETSFAVVFALALAVALVRGVSGLPLPGWLTTSMGMLCVLFRPELFVLVGLVAFAAVLEGRYRSAMIVLVGAIVALAIVQLAIGSFISDAAIAKARYGYAPWPFLKVLVMVIAGAGIFGVGLTALWGGLTTGSIVMLRVRQRIDRRELALAISALLPLGIVLATYMSGEALEGIRTLLPFIAFSLPCSAVLFVRLGGEEFLEDLWRRRRRLLCPAALSVLGGAVLLVAADWRAFDRLARHQASLLEDMKERRLSELRGYRGAAWEVGFISYFSKATICDLQGLVNGRAFAALSIDERLGRCAQDMDFAFVDQERFERLSGARDMRDWQVCARFAFAHRRASYWTYFLAAPGVAKDSICSHPVGSIGDRPTSNLSLYF